VKTPPARDITFVYPFPAQDAGGYVGTIPAAASADPRFCLVRQGKTVMRIEKIEKFNEIKNIDTL
jgi:hypothetical protein